MPMITFPPPPSNRPLKEEYLKYLWMFVPGIIDEHDSALPSTEVMEKYFAAFIQKCNDVNVVQDFEHGKTRYGWPWELQHDSTGGEYWSATFARAAYAINFGLSPHDVFLDEGSIWAIVKEQVWTTIFLEQEIWDNEMGRLFEQAKRMTEEFDDAMRKEVGDEVGGISEFPEEKARRAKERAERATKEALEEKARARQAMYVSQGFFLSSW